MNRRIVVRARRRFLAATLTLIGTASCGHADRGREAGSSFRDASTARSAEVRGRPRLRLLDSIILHETDSVYVGSPGAFFQVDSEWNLFIPDESTNRLLEYDRQGRFMGAFGRSGAGPGEFRDIGAVGLVTDSLVLQDSHGNRRVNIFDRRTRRYLGQFRYEGYLSGMSAGSDREWLALSDARGHRVLGWVAWSRVLSPMTEAAESAVVASFAGRPSEYDRYPLLNEWDDMKVAVLEGGPVLAIGGSDRLVRYSRDGVVRDTIKVPVVRRRGVRQEILERFFVRRPQTAAEARRLSDATSRAISALLGLWKMPDGSLLVWYQDPHFENGGRVLKGVAFLSIVTRDGSRACVDAAVEAPGSGRPRLDVKGDTILVLDQVVSTTGEPRVTTVVRRYLFDTSECEWLPTH